MGISAELGVQDMHSGEAAHGALRPDLALCWHGEQGAFQSGPPMWVAAGRRSRASEDPQLANYLRIEDDQSASRSSRLEPAALTGIKLCPMIVAPTRRRRKMSTPPEARRFVQRPGETRGGAWKGSLEELLNEEGTKRVRAHVREHPEDRDGNLTMRVPATLFLNFARASEESADDPEMTCVCTIFRDEDGSEVCICIGDCPDFPDCCDDGPIFTKG